jgi:hypothetical protein
MLDMRIINGQSFQNVSVLPRPIIAWLHKIVKDAIVQPIF